MASAIAFEPLLQGAASGGELAHPHLSVISTSEQRSNVTQQLAPADRPALERVDLSSNLVIAAFLGVRPTSGYAIEIRSIEVHDQTLAVSVRVVSPPPGQPVRQGFETPYQLVTVAAGALDLEQISDYRLVDESGALLASCPIRFDR